MSYSSDFWLKDYDIDWDFTENSEDVDVSNANTEKTANLIRLSAARRAVANYVTILTNKNIPVQFNDQNVNMTDGNNIYISGDINESNKFDVTVGLALHEGSHICYTNFDYFKSMFTKVPREIYEYSEKLNVSKDIIADTCRTVLNIVEDRYIDCMVYKSAPGYRGYYQSLYNKYFNSTAIDDGLKSNLYRVPTIESYIYRLCNITNVNTDLTALPGLYNIAKILNLSTIERLSKPEDRFDVSLEISKIIFENIDAQINKFNSNFELNQDQPASGEATANPEAGSKVNEKNNKSNLSLDDILGGKETQVTSADNGVVDNIGQDTSISKTKLTKIKKDFQKQKDFLNGKIKKKKVSKKDNQILNVLEQSQVDIVDVGCEYTDSVNVVSSIECILVKNMTKELIMSREFPMSYCSDYKINANDPLIIEMQKNVDQGISMGIKIGKRLQFRNEVNVDKFTRRETGKIDKKLLHELGFESENVFYTTDTSKFNKKNFHISIDASSSMYGEKWKKTIRLCAALAKAASMLENIRVTISFRTTLESLPYIVIAYDSNVDKFIKIKTLFAFLRPSGLTPEGLCYEALCRVIPQTGEGTDNYFINIGDGEPFFTSPAKTEGTIVSYSGEAAAYHTKKQVNKLKDLNYNIISYFVSDSPVENSRYDSKLNGLFKIMYGKDAKFINVESINQIIKSLNEKMLEIADV